MEPVDLADLRSLDELKSYRTQVRARLQELDVTYDGQPFPDDVRAEFAGLSNQTSDIDDRIKELEHRHAMIERQFRAGAVEGEISEAQRRRDRYQAAVAERPAYARAALDAGLRTIDHYRSSDVLSARAADNLDTMVRERDQLGVGARYLEAVGDPDYERAFEKIVRYPTDAQYRLEREETAALQRVARIEAERTGLEGTGSAGGFAVPFALDPSIIHSSSGAVNPLREMAKVLQIAAFQWKGVSADAPTAAYQAEGAAVADNTPTLAQPVITPSTGRAFVPASFELWMDWQGIREELVSLLQQSRDILDATKFLLGSGTNEPVGLLTVGTTGALTTTQRIQTAVAATFSVGDVYALKAAVAATVFYQNANWLFHPGLGDKIFRFVGGGNTTEPPIFGDFDRMGPVLGKPFREISTMVTTTTTGSKIAVLGDFSGFQIIDRIGVQVETTPWLYDQTTARPNLTRGLLMWWRTGCGVIAANKLRYLEVL